MSMSDSDNNNNNHKHSGRDRDLLYFVIIIEFSYNNNKSNTTTTSTVTSSTGGPPVSGSTTFVTSTSTTTTSSTSLLPSVTNDAYINAILIHHNIHRTNHSASALTWSPAMAETARVIAQTCVYEHVTNINGGGYGQSIGAGYPATPLGMGNFVTEGLYNSEVNNYVSYGSEPDTSKLNQWGHFTQIVWKSTTSVGCYTADCTATGLQNVGSGVPPYFTVCNYSPPGMLLTSLLFTLSLDEKKCPWFRVIMNMAIFVII
ncbi:hypothetical protein KCU88_g3629, partial [Aureobasidium melanogenum]